MVYNKTAIYKYKENNPEQYAISTREAALKYRCKNIKKCRIQQLNYKNARNYFIREWKSFRNIDIF